MLRWLRRLWWRIGATVSVDRARELRAELQFHLRSLEEDYLRQGLTIDEARRTARREFGNPAIIQEASHDLFAFRQIEELGHDCRVAVREARRSAAFTCIAVASLAIGIGAAAAVFAVVDATVLRTLPVRLPHQLVAFTLDGRAWARWSYGAFTRWQHALHPLADVAASAETVEIELRSGTAPAGTARVSLVSANYFQVLGADVARGRGLSDDDAREQRAVVVISDAFWRQEFGGAADILTRSIELRAVRHDIVGVARRGFVGHQTGYPVDMWAPLARQTVLRPGTAKLLDASPATDARWLTVIGRLGPDASLAQANVSTDLIRQAYLADRAAVLGEGNPEVARDRKTTVRLVPAARGDLPLHPRRMRPLAILAGIAALVLLVAYANFMNLMVARSESRRREFAIRFALGANRWRIVRQAATECVLLAGVATAMAVILALWANRASDAFATLVLTADLDLTFSRRQLGFAVLAGTAAAVCGLWASVGRGRVDGRSLGHYGAVSKPVSAWWSSRRMFLAGQLAACVVLSICAGLLLRTVLNLRSQDLGLDRGSLLVPVAIERIVAGSGSAASVVAAMKARLEAIPGVRAVGVSGAALLDPQTYWIDGSQRLTTDRGVALAGARWTFADVDDDFFEAAGMSLIKGRAFTSGEIDGAANVVVVNDALARFVFGADSPLGRRISLHPRGPMHTVIGVLNDARQTSPRDRGIGVVYLPMRTFAHVTFAVRPDAPVTANAAAIARRAESIAGDALAGRARSVSEALDRAIVQERVMSGIALVLALLVVAIGCVGIYALMSYEVTRRTHELGVRFALGATRRQIATIILRDAVAIAAAALLCGIPLGVAASRAVSSQLYGVTPDDPWTIAGVVLLLTLATIGAASKPATAAGRVDPLVLLRRE